MEKNQLIGLQQLNEMRRRQYSDWWKHSKCLPARTDTHIVRRSTTARAVTMTATGQYEYTRWQNETACTTCTIQSRQSHILCSLSHALTHTLTRFAAHDGSGGTYGMARKWNHKIGNDKDREEVRGWLVKRMTMCMVAVVLLCVIFCVSGIFIETRPNETETAIGAADLFAVWPVPFLLSTLHAHGIHRYIYTAIDTQRAQSTVASSIFSAFVFSFSIGHMSRNPTSNHGSERREWWEGSWDRNISKNEIGCCIQMKCHATFVYWCVWQLRKREETTRNLFRSHWIVNSWVSTDRLTNCTCIIVDIIALSHVPRPNFRFVRKCKMEPNDDDESYYYGCLRMKSIGLFLTWTERNITSAATAAAAAATVQRTSCIHMYTHTHTLATNDNANGPHRCVVRVSVCARVCVCYRKLPRTDHLSSCAYFVVVRFEAEQSNFGTKNQTHGRNDECYSMFRSSLLVLVETLWETGRERREVENAETQKERRLRRNKIPQFFVSRIYQSIRLIYIYTLHHAFVLIRHLVLVNFLLILFISSHLHCCCCCSSLNICSWISQTISMKSMSSSSDPKVFQSRCIVSIEWQT